MIKVKAHNKKDKKYEKVMSKLLDYEYKRNKELIDAVTRVRVILEQVYGIDTSFANWEQILEVVMTNYERKDDLPKV